MSIQVTEQTFDEEVLATDKPVLVDFWAEWCGPCRTVGPIVEQLAQDNADKLKVAKINVDESPQLAAKYGVRSIPTLMLFKDGDVKDVAVGSLPAGKLQSFVDQHID